MKKLFLIILISILATNISSHDFKDDDEMSIPEKIRNFLNFIANTYYNRILEMIDDQGKWPDLADEVRFIISEYGRSIQGDIKINEKAEEFCNNEMNLIGKYISFCEEFVIVFHSCIRDFPYCLHQKIPIVPNS